jgi:hypothetical protein
MSAVTAPPGMLRIIRRGPLFPGLGSSPGIPLGSGGVVGLAGQTAISPRALSAADARVLARLKGSSREHAESDLRCYLTWCAGHSLDPLAAQRPHLELKVIML